MAEILVDLYGTLVRPWKVEAPSPTTARPNTEEVMNWFQTHGHRTTLASSAAVEHGEKVLTDCGIRRGFDRIIHTDRTPVFDEEGRVIAAKMYGTYLTQDLGIPTEELSARCFFTGDEEGDAPGDVDGAVFFLDRAGYRRDARLPQEILEMFLEGGNGNISAGYNYFGKYVRMGLTLPSYGVGLKLHEWRFERSDSSNILVPVIEAFDLEIL